MPWNAINRLKHSWAVATRYDKRRSGPGPPVHIAAINEWLLPCG
jgi:hypothetical protein